VSVPGGGDLDLHNFRNREWTPAQRAAGIEPLRRVYDFRHTFATFALRAGISTFDLSRYMGASLTMIDRHYGHLARDGREHAILRMGRWLYRQRSPAWLGRKANTSSVVDADDLRALWGLRNLRWQAATPTHVDVACAAVAHGG
jgi:hypothetical protein